MAYIINKIQKRFLFIYFGTMNHIQNVINKMSASCYDATFTINSMCIRIITYINIEILISTLLLIKL